MADQNLSSSSVTVYPASSRTDTYDRYSKLNIEHNLINMINRLTGQDSFIIDGLTLSGDYGRTLAAGTCNIHGFLFNIGSYTLPNVENDKYLCLKIRVKVAEEKEELCNVADGSSAIDSSSLFTGICFTILADLNISAPYYILPIAKGVDGSWLQIVNDDGLDNHRAYCEPFNAEQILIKSSLSQNANIDKAQDLKTFLEKNFVIDDGVIE